jgi:hypothetical protein
VREFCADIVQGRTWADKALVLSFIVSAVLVSIRYV